MERLRLVSNVKSALLSAVCEKTVAAALVASALACAGRLPSAPAPSVPLHELNLERRFGPYLARDAVWVAQQPVLVNRDFDFAIAMAPEGFGAGLAASRRQKGNAALANALAQRSRIDSAQLTELLTDAEAACEAWNPAGRRIYGMVYGQQRARLRVVIESSENAGLTHHAALGESRAESAFLEPGVLSSDFAAGIATLVHAFCHPAPSSGAMSQRGRCNIGGHHSVAGDARPLTDGTWLMALTGLSLRSMLVCPADAFVTDRR
jgi:hypothetical protein